MRADRLFFGSMSALVAGTVFVGFARTYYLRGLSETPPPGMPLTPLVHLHALLFTGWIGMLLVQAGLVAAGRADLHRKLGLVGAGLAVAMVGIGLATAVHGMGRGSGPPGIDPRRFLAIPFFDLVVFAGLAFAGIRARRDPQAHKRWMLAATIAILPAAVARWPVPLIAAGGPLAFFGLANLHLVPMFVFDLATRRRIHPATAWASLAIVASGPLRLLLSGTDLWLRFAESVAAATK